MMVSVALLTRSYFDAAQLQLPRSSMQFAIIKYYLFYIRSRELVQVETRSRQWCLCWTYCAARCGNLGLQRYFVFYQWFQSKLPATLKLGSQLACNSCVLFQISIQSPDDFARTGRIGFLASPGNQIDAAVTGQTQIGDDRLRAIDLDKRLCTTTQEITLKYFHDYTGPYCQLDCLTRFFLEECRCVPYYYPGKSTGIFQEF